MKLIIAILIGVGLFQAVRMLYRKMWARGLSVAIDFPDRTVYEGEESTLSEVILRSSSTTSTPMRMQDSKAGMEFSG